MRCRCGVYVLCFANLTLSYKASKNLETFQETSSRLPGTPLPAVTGLVVNPIHFMNFDSHPLCVQMYFT